MKSSFYGMRVYVGLSFFLILLVFFPKIAHSITCTPEFNPTPDLTVKIGNQADTNLSFFNNLNYVKTFQAGQNLFVSPQYDALTFQASSFIGVDYRYTANHTLSVTSNIVQTGFVGGFPAQVTFNPQSAMPQHLADRQVLYSCSAGRTSPAGAAYSTASDGCLLSDISRESLANNILNNTPLTVSTVFLETPFNSQCATGGQKFLIDGPVGQDFGVNAQRGIASRIACDALVSDYNDIPLYVLFGGYSDFDENQGEIFRLFSSSSANRASGSFSEITVSSQAFALLNPQLDDFYQSVDGISVRGTVVGDQNGDGVPDAVIAVTVTTTDFQTFQTRERTFVVGAMGVAHEGTVVFDARNSSTVTLTDGGVVSVQAVDNNGLQMLVARTESVISEISTTNVIKVTPVEFTVDTANNGFQAVAHADFTFTDRSSEENTLTLVGTGMDNRKNFYQVNTLETDAFATFEKTRVYTVENRGDGDYNVGIRHTLDGFVANVDSITHLSGCGCSDLNYYSTDIDTGDIFFNVATGQNHDPTGVVLNCPTTEGQGGDQIQCTLEVENIDANRLQATYQNLAGLDLNPQIGESDGHTVPVTFTLPTVESDTTSDFQMQVEEVGTDDVACGGSATTAMASLTIRASAAGGGGGGGGGEPQFFINGGGCFSSQMMESPVQWGGAFSWMVGLVLAGLGRWFKGRRDR